MYKIIVSWPYASFISDNLNHEKIPFQLYVTSWTKAEIHINDADAVRAENICKGWTKI